MPAPLVFDPHFSGMVVAVIDGHGEQVFIKGGEPLVDRFGADLVINDAELERLTDAGAFAPFVGDGLLVDVALPGGGVQHEYSPRLTANTSAEV